MNQENLLMTGAPLKQRRWSPFVIGGILLFVVVVIATTLALLFGRGNQSTVPGPSSATGWVEANNGEGKYCAYEYLSWHTRYWDDKGAHFYKSTLQIIIFDDALSGHSSHGNSSSQDDFSLDVGQAWSDENVLAYEYTATTFRNETVEFRINGVVYDLTQGSVFLIHMNDGSAVVAQVMADLSSVDINFDYDNNTGIHDRIQDFAQSNEDVSNFMQEYGKESA